MTYKHAVKGHMRDVIWNAVRSKVTEGMILPWWALAVRAVLYPLDFLFWRMSRTRGYQWQSDTWLIEGVTYSGTALRHLAAAQGETYRVYRTGETVTLERVHNEKLTGGEPTPSTERGDQRHCRTMGYANHETNNEKGK